MADRDTVIETARQLFNTTIKGLPVQRVLIEERLDIQHEYYVSITIDRIKKQPVILFAETGARHRRDCPQEERCHPLGQFLPSPLRYTELSPA